MSSLNPKRQKPVTSVPHRNFMGGNSYDISSPLVRLRIAASSCFFGEPMYYRPVVDGAPGATRVSPRTAPAARTTPTVGTARNVVVPKTLEYLGQVLGTVLPSEWNALTPASLMERAIDEALAVDPEAVLAEAIRLRNVEHMRTTPQVMLVRAAHHPLVRGTGLVRQLAGSIMKRADEPAVGLSYQLSRYGRPIPNALKRAWSDVLSGLSEHQLAKYRMSSREVSTVDVVNLTHPRGEAVNKLVRGDLSVTGATWEAIISQQGSTGDAWRKAIDVMGHMALLRNVRNLLQASVAPSEFMPKLLETAEAGKQLPFRYYSAYTSVKEIAPRVVLDGIEDCLVRSLGRLPRFEGRVMSLCDNSGSAQGTTTSSMGSVRVSTIANLSGVLAAMRADHGEIGIFGDRLRRLQVRARDSVFEQLAACDQLATGIGQSTENGIWLFWDQAIRQKEHWDHVFVFSDMQAGHGGLYGTTPSQYNAYRWQGTSNIDVAKLVATYRAQVNPHVKVYLVQVAGYRDTLIPEFHPRTYILGGWGEGLLRFAAEMAEIMP